jgi:phosphate-selective porin OprO/OprP
MPLHLSQDLVDTGALATGAFTMFGLEAATVFGPWSLQGEWLRTSVDLRGSGRATLPGFYVQGSFFLTGESRSYQASRAHFSWPELGETGAWEIAARYAQTDFNSGAVRGGELATTSLGLNWYFSDSVKAQLDYELARLADVGTAHGLAVRLEFIW